MPQNSVGRGAMKIEIRQRDVQQIIAT
jgi:hypothetical protein